jgi:hypothetical protein
MTNGRLLNSEWNVGARHALYRENGTWYHRLERFPAALFDASGYVRFESIEALKNCPGIQIGDHANWLNVPSGIASLPGYVRVHSQLDSDADLAPMPAQSDRNSPSAASDPYIRYVAAFEARISPRHHELQTKFENFLRAGGIVEIRPNIARVDLRFRDPRHGRVLAEVKPCDQDNLRYAIRAAIGQLLDYRQHERGVVSLLIVLEKRPNNLDRLLATTNGFAVAYPVGQSFKIIWPK